MVGEAGFENGESASVDEASRGYVASKAHKVDDEARKVADAEAFGQSFGQADDVERALAKALGEAAAAGRFDVVARLARELEARRLATTENVVPLDPRRRGLKG